MRKAEKAQERKQQLDDMNISEAEEIELGADVSAKIRERFGVVQDPAVHKYVALVGTVLTEQTTRPKLPWTFIVLDTDGVNAFAAPGGYVHITRGALGLIKTEAELAGVLGHEIAHVAQKHTVNAIRKSKVVQAGASETLVEQRGVPRPAGEPRLRHGARELLRSRRRARRRQGRRDARPEGRLRRTGAGGFSDAAGRTQQGPGREERPVRVASRDTGAHQQGQAARRLRNPAPLVAARYASSIKYPADRHRQDRGRRGRFRGADGREQRSPKPKKEEEPKSKGFRARKPDQVGDRRANSRSRLRPREAQEDWAPIAWPRAETTRTS